MILKHTPTSNTGKFVKQYTPTGRSLTNMIILDDGREYFAPANEFVVTFQNSENGLRKRREHTFIETPSFAEIWAEHDKRIAEIDQKYLRDKILLFIGITFAIGLIIWALMDPDFFGL